MYFICHTLLASVDIIKNSFRDVMLDGIGDGQSDLRLSLGGNSCSDLNLSAHVCGSGGGGGGGRGRVCRV